jgi:hypothetical protein
MSQRLADIFRFYNLFELLEAKMNGRRRLRDCNGCMSWPERGVYFFMEPGEQRSDSGVGSRVVRVGTHALRASSHSTLWGRLSQHKGQERSGGGNHRGSIFRLLVGSSLLNVSGPSCSTWGIGTNAPAEVRRDEAALELRVSEVVRAMPFVFLPINDAPGPESLRGYVEGNTIALLSNLRKEPIDAASSAWLGRRCDRGRALVRDSGMWNQNHVHEVYHAAFLETLEMLVEQAAERA